MLPFQQGLPATKHRATPGRLAEGKAFDTIDLLAITRLARLVPCLLVKKHFVDRHLADRHLADRHLADILGLKSRRYFLYVYYDQISVG